MGRDPLAGSRIGIVEIRGTSEEDDLSERIAEKTARTIDHQMCRAISLSVVGFTGTFRQTLGSQTIL